MCTHGLKRVGVIVVATLLSQAGSIDRGHAQTPAACSNADAISLAACVDQEQYAADVAQLAVQRPPFSPGWQMAQDFCAQRLTELGFDVGRHTSGGLVNVIGRLESGREGPVVVVSAHYDHIEGCTGADDNATGVAAVLEMARVFSTADLPGTLIAACWDQEEWGLLGSTAWANALPPEYLDAVVVFDMIGFTTDLPNSQSMPPGFDLIFPGPAARLAERDGRGDFIALLGDTGSLPLIERVYAQADTTGLPVIGFALNPLLIEMSSDMGLQRSDHASFWAAGFPAVLFSDSAEYRNPHYHCMTGDDSLDTLDLDFAALVVRTVVAALADYILSHASPEGPAD